MRFAIIGCALALISAPLCAAPASKKANPDAALLAAAKTKVGEQMKDPSSIQWRGIHVVSGTLGKKVCGEFNAKNGYGGYVGFSKFVFDGMIAAVDDGTPGAYGLISAGC